MFYILSNTIAGATIVTLLFALSAYFMYKLRDKGSDRAYTSAGDAQDSFTPILLHRYRLRSTDSGGADPVVVSERASATGSPKSGVFSDNKAHSRDVYTWLVLLLYLAATGTVALTASRYHQNLVTPW